jgi:hypothetical protein
VDQPVLTLLVLLTGCSATLAEVMQAKAESAGTQRTYSVTPDQAWSIAETIFRWEGFGAIEEHREQGYMLTTSPMTFWSGGTLAGVWISPEGSDQSVVAVVIRRREKTALVTMFTEDDFHRRFEEVVALTKSGKPIPLTPPTEGKR